MEPLRILYHHRTRALDGQAVHVRALIRGLRSLGHQVQEVAMVLQGDRAAGTERGGALSLVRFLPRCGGEILEHA